MKSYALTPDQRAAAVAGYAAGERLAVVAARLGCSPAAISQAARAAGLPRRIGGGRPAPLPGEYTAPHAGAALRPPLLPWYTEQPDPTPPPLADVVARPMSRYQRSSVPLWPRGADEEALCIG
jgi:hypothetical protein